MKKELQYKSPKPIVKAQWGTALQLVRTVAPVVFPSFAVGQEMIPVDEENQPTTQEVINHITSIPQIVGASILAMGKKKNRTKSKATSQSTTSTTTSTSEPPKKDDKSEEESKEVKEETKEEASATKEKSKVLTNLRENTKKVIDTTTKPVRVFGRAIKSKPVKITAKVAVPTAIGMTVGDLAYNYYTGKNNIDAEKWPMWSGFANKVGETVYYSLGNTDSVPNTKKSSDSELLESVAEKQKNSEDSLTTQQFKSFIHDYYNK